MNKLNIPIACNMGDRKWFMFNNKPVEGRVSCIIIPQLKLKKKVLENSELVNPDLHLSYEMESLNGVYLITEKSYKLFNTKAALLKSL